MKKFLRISGKAFVTADGIDYDQKSDRGRGCYSKTAEEPDPKQVALSKRFISENCEPSKGYSKKPPYTSYGWKHYVEDWINGLGNGHVYISNGAFIQAAMESGIQLRISDDKINARLKLRLKRGVVIANRIN